MNPEVNKCVDDFRRSMKNHRLITVLVADDHQQILESIQHTLKSFPKVGMVDLSCDGLSAYTKASNRQYDVYIIDLRLPQIDGFTLIHQIRKANPAAKIIINTMCDELWDAKRILELDVDAIVIKSSSLSHLKDAIDAVLTGEKYACPKFRQLEKQQNAGAYLNLSKREIEVLHAIAEGWTTDDISEQYNLSENTVESIRKRLMLKMDARNMAQLINKAHKIGLLSNYCTDAEPD